MVDASFKDDVDVVVVFPKGEHDFSVIDQSDADVGVLSDFIYQ